MTKSGSTIQNNMHMDWSDVNGCESKERTQYEGHFLRTCPSMKGGRWGSCPLPHSVGIPGDQLAQSSGRTICYEGEVKNN